MDFATRAGDLLVKPLLNGIKAKPLPWIRDDINIIQSKLGEYIAARGAATLVPNSNILKFTKNLNRFGF